MIATLPKLIEAVRDSLSELVLPELKPNSWTAGNVRSCLALLTYMEDALEKGGASLGMSNSAIVEFLTAVVAGPKDLLNDDVRAEVDAILPLLDIQSVRDVQTLNDDNAKLRQLLSDVVSCSAKNPAWEQQWKGRLYQCLGVVAEQEMVMASRASEMSPF